MEELTNPEFKHDRCRGAERTCKALPNEALCTSPRKREMITPVYLQI